MRVGVSGHNSVAKIQHIPQIAALFVREKRGRGQKKDKCPFLKKVDSVCWFNLGWLTLCLRVVV